RIVLRARLDVRIEDRRAERAGGVHLDVGRHVDDGAVERFVPDLERVRRAALAPGAADARVDDLADGDVAPAVLRQIEHLDAPLAPAVCGGRGETPPTARRD